MLFINHRKNAQEAKDYFTRHMERSDYYLRDSEEMPGQWHGLGSQLLGLSGTVDKERYFALCDNINPATGERLTAHTKTARRILYDFTFDAPKSVSLAFEVGGDERIMDEFRGAVADTMTEMEASMMARVRSNKRDENRTTSNMVWGEFIHRTARPVDGVPDPQLHCHAVAFNATFDPEEDKWKAGEFSSLIADKGYYQAAFHSRFASRLANLGYGIERDGKSFRLAGIEPGTSHKFSRRTDIIEAEAERLGITDAGLKSQLGQRTREAKDAEGLSMFKLQAEWKKRLTDAERNAIFKARFGQESTSPGASESMDYALSHCFTRESAVPEKELLKTALIHGVGNADVRDIQQELSRPNILRRVKGGICYATTREVWQQEQDMKDFVRNGCGKFPKLGGVNPQLIDAALGKEHQEAGRVILNSRDRVTALKGGAGTGKTTLLKAVVKEINSAGKEVYTFASSTDAVSVLRHEGFTNANTIARLLDSPIATVLAEGRQTEPILITAAGVVVNGNRRLAAMRELYASGETGMQTFSHVNCKVLPVAVTDKEIKEIEVKLQMQPETKLPYTWVNEALTIKDLMLSNFTREDIARDMRKPPKDVDIALQSLSHAEIYLKDWKRSAEDYEQVEGAQQLFGDMARLLKEKTGEELELSRRIAFTIQDNSKKLRDRAYAFNFSFGKKSGDVAEALAARLGVDMTAVPTDEAEEIGGLDIDLDEESEGSSYKPLIDIFDDAARREEIAAELISVCESIRSAEQDEKRGQAALKTARDANTKLLEIDLSTADPSTHTAIAAQLDSVMARAKKLKDEINGTAATASSKA